jgi:hypothetical protein
MALGDNSENPADDTGDGRAGLEWVSLPAVFAPVRTPNDESVSASCCYLWNKFGIWSALIV